MVEVVTENPAGMSILPGPLVPELGFSVGIASGPEAFARHRAFCANAVFAPAQHPAWTELWAREANPDIIFVTAKRDGRPVLSLPLEIIRNRGLTAAIHVGERHANGNFPALLVDDAAALPADLARLTVEAVRAFRPEIDLVALERMHPEMAGAPNPFITAQAHPSPNVALAVDLAGGFDAVLSRHSGKRKRKKHRSNARKFEAMGGHRVFMAQSEEEAQRLLDSFFEIKGRRLNEIGATDVFADERVRRFFKALFAADAASSTPAFVVHALEVGGELRAITGSSLSGERMTCEFSAFVASEDVNTSPGDFLFFENIAWACDKGLAVHDFGVGDESYKRLWCSIETIQMDCFLPVGARGAIAAAGLNAIAAAKRKMKSSPRLWQAVKDIRRAVRGSREPEPALEQDD